MRLYTRTGDLGGTSTLGGRVFKNDAKVAAQGAIDALSAQLAVVFETYAAAPDDGLGKYVYADLVWIQHDLLDLGTHVSALVPPDAPTLWRPWTYGVTPIMGISSEKYAFAARHFPLEQMEQHIDELCAAVPDLKRFVLCTGSPLTAHVHVARSAARAAEAAVVAVLRTATYVEARDQILLRYLNRLSDYLFALARLCTYAASGAEIEH